MPEEQNIPISSFPDAESINGGDKVTGLQNNANTNFSFSAILSWLVNAFRSAFVPAARTVNNKSLATDITLTASDVGARPDTWTPTAEGIGAIPASEKGEPLGVPELDSSGKVPSSQLPTIPSQPSDIGAQPTITASGILKGDGAGNVTAATAGTDYQTPLVAGTDYATPGQLDTKANQAQLATVESGSTASRAYAVGEYFCWNGLLYRATAAISSGGSFTPGTNCEAVTVGTELIDVMAEVDSAMNLIRKSYNLGPGKKLTITPADNQSACRALCSTFGSAVAENTLTLLNIYSRNSNYHIFVPVVTGSVVSITTSGGVVTIANNHATHTISVCLEPVSIDGSVAFNII